MKKLNLIKIMAISLIATSVIILNPIKASAFNGQYSTNHMYTANTHTFYADSSQWIYKNGSWTCAQPDFQQAYANAWICTNGRWYYVNENCYMVSNTWVDDYYVGSDGAWIPNATKDVSMTGGIASSNINANTNINTTSTSSNNTSNNIYTNRTVAKYQAFDGNDGFKEVENNKYIYYENGKILNNCWKEFDDGFRYFGENGYMVCDTSIGGTIHLGSDGAITISGKKLSKEETRKRISVDIAKILILDKSLSLDEIEYTAGVFNIKVNTEYEDVYDKTNDGKILNITGLQYNEDSYEICDSITIHIGKYKSRLNL